jgi:TolB protein
LHRSIYPVAALLATLALCSGVAHAQVRGEITGPGATHLPIAVPGLKHLGGEPATGAAADFARVLAKDLDMSGLFQVINPKAYIEDAQASGLTRDTINFDNWRAIGALGLVRGGYYGTPTGITIESRFFDVADQSSSGGMRFTGDVRDVPQMAHRMADSIIDYLTGRRGPFASTIAFVSNRNDRFREVYTFTFDGEVRQVSHERSIFSTRLRAINKTSPPSLVSTSVESIRPMRATSCCRARWPAMPTST